MSRMAHQWGAVLRVTAVAFPGAGALNFGEACEVVQRAFILIFMLSSLPTEECSGIFGTRL